MKTTYRFSALLTAALLAGASAAQAQNVDTYWRNVGSDWGTPGNWTNGVPNANNHQPRFDSVSEFDHEPDLGNNSYIAKRMFANSLTGSFTIRGTGELVYDPNDSRHVEVLSASAFHNQLTFDTNVRFHNSAAGAAYSVIAGDNATVTFVADKKIDFTGSPVTLLQLERAHFVIDSTVHTDTRNRTLIITGSADNGYGELTYNPTSVTGTGTLGVRVMDGSSIQLLKAPTGGLRFGNISGTNVSGGTIMIAADGLTIGGDIATQSATVGTTTYGISVDGAASANHTGNITLHTAAGQVHRFSADTDDTLYLTGVISGGNAGGSFVKIGDGDVVIGGSGANTFASGVQVAAGTLGLAKTGGATAISSPTLSVADDATLRLDGNEQVNNNAAITLSGGTFDANGFTESLGTLALEGDSTLDLGELGALIFADSSSLDWAGHTLTIAGYEPGSSTLRFGDSEGGLTEAQLANVRFADFGNAAGHIDANGFVSPIPEPGVLGSLLMLGAGAAMRRRSHR